MISAAVHLVVLAHFWTPMPIDTSNPDTTVTKFEEECPGARAATEKCKQSRRAVEKVLMRDLTFLEREGEPISDREILGAALRASWPPLRAKGLRLLSYANPGPKDLPLVEPLLEDPSPAVRAAARDLLGVLDGERAMQLAQRDNDGAGQRRSNDSERMVPEEIPAAAVLGAPIFAGAQYRFSTSGPLRAMFTTAAPVEKVVAFYAKGRRVQSASEMKRAKKQPDMADVAAISARYQKIAREAAGDQAKLMAGLQAMQFIQPYDWSNSFRHMEGVSDLRFVTLREASTEDAPGPARVLAIWRDDVFKSTAFAFLRAEGDPLSGPRLQDLSFEDTGNLEQIRSAIERQQRPALDPASGDGPR